MPALQLVDGMLATLGNRHATITNQVTHLLPFIYSIVLISYRPWISYQAIARPLLSS